MGEVPAKTPSRLAKSWNLWLTLGVVVLWLVLQALLRYRSHLRGIGVVITERGEALVCTSSAWMIVPLMVPAAVMLVIGVILARRGGTPRRAGGAVLVLAALAFTVAFPPAILSGGVVVGPDGLTSTYGFWWRPVSKSVRFDDLTLMAVVHRRNGGGLTDETLECHTRRGDTVTMPVGDSLAVALPTIERRAERHGVGVVDIWRGGMGAPARAGWGLPSWMIVVLVLPCAVFVGLLVLVFAAKRWHPTNRMARRLVAGDAAGAIRIGESVPPARREFSTRCNLAIAYKNAGRDDDARALLAEIETEGWKPAMCSEDQYGVLLDNLCAVVGAASNRPDGPSATGSETT